MMSIGVLNNNGSTFSSSESLEEQIAFVDARIDEFVIGISSLHMVAVVIIMVISMVVIVVTTAESSHLS